MTGEPGDGTSTVAKSDTELLEQAVRRWATPLAVRARDAEASLAPDDPELHRRLHEQIDTLPLSELADLLEQASQWWRRVPTQVALNELSTAARLLVHRRDHDAAECLRYAAFGLADTQAVGERDIAATLIGDRLPGLREEDVAETIIETLRAAETLR